LGVLFGIDCFLLDRGSHQHTRFGLVTNNSAVTSSYVPSRQALLSAGHRVTTLFSPEHGLQTNGPDGARMMDGLDSLTQLPVISLYGDQLEPSASALSNVDVVLLDLPDVGCRCYTYLWTLSYVMQGCARHGKPLIILDRPNPISGVLNLAEGPRLDEQKCSSFIGRWNIPLRHSGTFGELALLWKATRVPTLDLQVIRATGWQRSMFYHDYAASFVPTSPAIANFEACLLYPGLCLLEATNLNEGRGTPLSFRVAGAPWMDAFAITKQFNQLEIPGVFARAVTYDSGSTKYRELSCNSVILHVTQTRTFRPVLAGLMLIKLLRDQHPEHFAWATYPTHVNPSGSRHLDKLLGIDSSESLFDLSSDAFLPAVRQSTACHDWISEIEPYLLYV
jgi:uncharacterized protein YbbC (DUF1343 family)